MPITTHAAASAAILAAADAGLLIQGEWHRRAEDGRELACLLGSIHPGVKNPHDCTGDLMPLWMAYLTAHLFDGVPKGDIVPIARRYGALIARWHTLMPDAWDSVRREYLVYVIDLAADAARPLCDGKSYWRQVSGSCAQAKVAIRPGDIGDAEAAVRASLAAIWRVTRMSAKDGDIARAAEAAARAAWDAVRAAAEAPSATVVAATAWAAHAAACADGVNHATRVATGVATRVAARAGAYRRLFVSLLDVVENQLAEVA